MDMRSGRTFCVRRKIHVRIQEELCDIVDSFFGKQKRYAYNIRVSRKATPGDFFLTVP